MIAFIALLVPPYNSTHENLAGSIPQKIVNTEDLSVVFSQCYGFREAAHCQHSGSQSSDEICLRFQVNVEPVNQLSNYLSFKRHSTLQSTNQLDFWWWWGSAKAKVIWRSKLKHFNETFELCAHAGQYFDTSIDSIIHFLLYWLHWHIWLLDLFVNQSELKNVRSY